MPNRRKRKGKQNHRKIISSSAVSACVFPWEIISVILSRLPVNALLRFRCVCKPWRTLISSPKFIYAHLNFSPTSLLVYAVQTPLSVILAPLESTGHLISVHRPKFMSPHVDQESYRVLWHPVTRHLRFSKMDVVGSVNGVVCLSHPPWAQSIFLWNPATRLSKLVPFSEARPNPEVNTKVSIGLAFDPACNDCKIIRLQCFKLLLMIPDKAEVYSLNTGRWRELKMYVKFWVIGTKCDVIIEGVPYWRAVTWDAVGVRAVLVYFKDEVFEILSLPWIMDETDACIGEFKDSLGMVIWDKSKERSKDQVFDIWMMDDDKGWSKKFSVGPISLMDRVVGFYGDGGIIGEHGQGKLVLYNLESMDIEDCISVEGAEPGSFDVVNYKESLVSIAGQDGIRL